MKRHSYLQPLSDDHHRALASVWQDVRQLFAAEFAALLERHVRFEQRELFPRAELLLTAHERAFADRLGEAIRQACTDAALGGYEDASLGGLCHQGAWEAAISAIRRVKLPALPE